MESIKEKVKRYCSKINARRALEYVNSFADEEMKREQKVKLMKLAITSNRVDLVQLILNDGFSEEDICSKKNCIFHFTCCLGNVEIIKLLLDHISDINVKDVNGNTALHWACIKGHLELAKFLVHKGVDINIKNDKQVTPIRAAVLNKDIAMVKFLIDKGADLNYKYDGRTLLHITVYTGYYDITRILIENGANINEVDNNGLTVLHAFCYKNEKDLVELCLDNGADVNIGDNRKFTPLYLACIANNLEIAKMLYMKGAHVNVKTIDGLPLLHRMIMNNSVEMIEFLIKHGADINLKVSNGLVAIHMACVFDNIKLVKLFLKNGADVNARSNNDDTPIIIAAAFSSRDIIDILLNNGANTSIITKDNITVLHLACERNIFALIKLFVERGVPLDVQTSIKGDTPLHILCRKGNEEGIKLLLDKGVNVDLQDFEGKTPLDILCYNNFSDIACIVAKKARMVSDDVLDWAIEEENLELLKSILLIVDNPERIVKKLVIKNQPETLKEILAELRMREMDLDIRQRQNDSGVTSANNVSLLGLSVLNNNIEISGMLMEYNTKQKKRLTRKLSDTLHNEDANELLINPSNGARRLIKKIKLENEEILMNELKNEDEVAYNKYKFGRDDNVSSKIIFPKLE